MQHRAAKRMTARLPRLQILLLLRVEAFQTEMHERTQRRELLFTPYLFSSGILGNKSNASLPNMLKTEYKKTSGFIRVGMLDVQIFQE